jgi:transketolase
VERLSTDISSAIRRIVIDQSRRANVGHIGSALSIADILAMLYGGTLRGGPGDDDRDRFVLSKGHAVLALYAALHVRGVLSESALDSYCGEGSPLGSHPEHAVDGIDFSTGSLGHGLSLAAGAALAARLQGSQRRAFVLLSDAEMNEGSVWEAAMFAAHHRLAALIAIADVNGQQALGYTADVMDLAPLSDRWRAFGWDVHEVDGHDVDALQQTVDGLDTEAGPPHIVLARTTFGRGVSFMENQIAWHYWPLSEEQHAQALVELEGGS